MFHVTRELAELPYDMKALDPILSEETFNYHYGKHHVAYVKNLKNLVKGTSFEDCSVETIIRTTNENNNFPLFNNAAQHWSHSFFWYCMSPNGGKSPSGKIAELINRDFGTVDAFKNQFSNVAAKLFGAGWTWLAQNEFGKLEIIPMKNAHTPLTENKTPLLTLDVWEHAYYIDYRNARPKFIEGFWDVVNWDFANDNIIK